MPNSPDLHDARAYGDVTAAVAPASAALAAKLAKVAESKRRLASLIGAGGRLSAEKLGGKSIDEIGAVVEGVNDPPPGSDDASTPVSDDPVASAPLSPAALADLRARAARYGGGLPAETSLASTGPIAAPPTGVRPRAFDASEGTRLDPLLNKTYDLNYPKNIPEIR